MSSRVIHHSKFLKLEEEKGLSRTMTGNISCLKMSPICSCKKKTNSVQPQENLMKRRIQYAKFAVCGPQEDQGLPPHADPEQTGELSRQDQGGPLLHLREEGLQRGKQQFGEPKKHCAGIIPKEDAQREQNAPAGLHHHVSSLHEGLATEDKIASSCAGQAKHPLPKTRQRMQRC